MSESTRSEPTNLEWTNARVSDVRIGSNTHDFRAFLSIMFEWDGARQGFNWGTYKVVKFIDRLCECAGVESATELKGKVVRIAHSGYGSSIEGVKHIINEKPMLIFSEFRR